MINVSSEFKEIMMQRQDFKENAEVTFSDGTVLNLEEKDFSISNNGVVDAADANAVPIGAALCRNIQIELLNDDNHLEPYDFYGAKVRLYLTFALSNTVEKIEFGTFTVTSPECYGTVVTVNAFDDMYKANTPYFTDLSFPATAGAVLRDACSRCNILMGITSFLHDDFQIQTKPSEEYTYRQIIGYIAMIACGNARINRNGKLEILTYNLDFGRECHNLTEWKSLTTDTSDITITGIQTTRKVKKVEGGTEKEAEETVCAGSEGYILSVSNPLVSGNEETLVSWLHEHLSGIPFRKFTGDYITYPLAEFMDLAKITDWRGNIFHTFLTDINFVFFGITTLKNSAEAGLRNTATYGNSNTQTNVYLQSLIEQERSDRKKAVKNLGEAIKAGSGMYATYEKQPDGSTITYLHDKPTLQEAQTVIKITSEAVGVSNDGGKTYPYGFILDGDMIARILHAHGISADYINTGAITVRDSSGNIIFLVDMDTGRVVISGDSVMIGGKTATQAIRDAENAAALARNISMQLSNDYQSISVDADGNYKEFPDGVVTIPTVMYGTQDISGDCIYTISKSDSIQGIWDKDHRIYTVTGLAADTGWVDIKAVYIQGLSVIKRFTVSKLYAGGTGPKGDKGNPGTDALTLVITSSNGNIFKNTTIATTLTAHVYKAGAEVLGSALAALGTIKWYKDKGTNAVATGSTLTINPGDVSNNASYTAQLEGAIQMAVKAKDTISLTRVNDGIPGRTYFIEASSNVLKRSKDNTISPNFIEFKAYYRDGNSAARTPYAGRFIIEETVDGNTWKTIYTSTANEDTVKHYLYSLLSTQTGQIVAAENGSIIGVPRDVTSVRCKLYASGGTTNLMDMQSVAVVVDVDALTVDEILDIITDNGKWQGFYKGPDNKLYVSFEAAMGGLLKLGGSNNGNGQLIILNSENNEIGKINKDGSSLQGNITSRRVFRDGTFVEAELGPYGLKFSNSDAIENEKFVLDVIPGGNTPYVYSQITLADDTSFDISGDSWAMLQIVPYNNHEVKVMGNFKVESGSKSRIANTRNFDKRLLYCYETPTPMFGDMGCASTNEKGIAIVDIDPIFYETVNTNIEYQVFLQKEGQGDLWVEEKDPNYFIVNGTPNLKFSWEAKCIQKEFESLRLENEDLEASVSKDIWNAENDITKEIETNVINYDKEMEELINESGENY